ncbi:hypothetical protein R3P38DRAFT_3415372 [Favolaschia claudopus]|uniref:Uncharacterized protein n=1 Tax=Favolaschia claudopus TaxID=2862362 RepID=A0AAW0EFR4_9AGAR
MGGGDVFSPHQERTPARVEWANGQRSRSVSRQGGAFGNGHGRAATSLDYTAYDRDEGDEPRTAPLLRTYRSSAHVLESAGARAGSAQGRYPDRGMSVERHLQDDRERERHAAPSPSPFGSVASRRHGSGGGGSGQHEHTRLMVDSLAMFEGHLARVGGTGDRTAHWHDLAQKRTEWGCSVPNTDTTNLAIVDEGNFLHPSESTKLFVKISPLTLSADGNVGAETEGGVALSVESGIGIVGEDPLLTYPLQSMARSTRGIRGRISLFRKHNFLLQCDPYLSECRGGIYALEETVVDPITGVWLGTRVKYGSTNNLRRRQREYRFCGRVRWRYLWLSDCIWVTVDLEAIVHCRLRQLGLGVRPFLCTCGRQHREFFTGIGIGGILHITQIVEDVLTDTLQPIFR